MKKFIAAAVIASVSLGGCSIRLVGIVETEDAIYGKASVTKEQKYDPKHLGFVESIMGAVNSESLDAVGRINSGEAKKPDPFDTPAVITPLPPGTPVLIQP